MTTGLYSSSFFSSTRAASDSSNLSTWFEIRKNDQNLFKKSSNAVSSNEIAIIIVFNIQNQVEFLFWSYLFNKTLSQKHSTVFPLSKKSRICNVKICCYFLLYIKEYQYKTLFKFLLLVLEFIERRRLFYYWRELFVRVWRSMEVCYCISSGWVSTGFDSLASC